MKDSTHLCLLVFMLFFVTIVGVCLGYLYISSIWNQNFNFRPKQ